jgi:hypothetical protein
VSVAPRAAIDKLAWRQNRPSLAQAAVFGKHPLRQKDRTVERLVRLIGVSVCAIAPFLCVGCGNPYQEKVIGTWETREPVLQTYVLEKGGTGSIKVSALGQNVTKSVTWRLNGNNLIFKIDGKELGGLIRSIDDQKMVLNDPDVKKDVTFTRVK